MHSGGSITHDHVTPQPQSEMRHLGIDGLEIISDEARPSSAPLHFAWCTHPAHLHNFPPRKTFSETIYPSEACVASCTESSSVKKILFAPSLSFPGLDLKSSERRCSPGEGWVRKIRLNIAVKGRRETTCRVHRTSGAAGSGSNRERQGWTWNI